MTNKIMKLSVASLLVFNMAACQKASFETSSEDDVIKKGDGSEKPLCELDPVDFNIKTSVYAFELTDNTEISFGFNILNDFFKALGLEIKLKRGALDLAMKVTDPLNEAVPLAFESGQGKFKAGGVSAKIDLSQIGIGFSFFAQTPLAGLTRDGLQSGFDNVVTKLAAQNTPWQNKVTKVIDEDNVVLSIGAVAGIRPGDKFGIYNVRNVWTGKPCESELLIKQKLSDEPIAIAEATQVQNNAAILRIVSRTSAERIEPGAMIEIKELKKANKNDQRALAKSMRISAIASEPLVINNVKVNIVQYMKNQLGPLITEKGFYLHE